MTDNNYTITVQQSEESDDLYFEIPEPVLERLGWGEDTEVEFTVVEGEGFMLKKVSN